MKTYFLTAFVAGALSLAGSTQLTAAEASGSVQQLFNGRDLAGWDGNPKLWSVQDGVIVGRTTEAAPLSGNTFLIWTNGTVSDFELRCSFKIVPNNDKGFANSGIQYRSKVLDPAKWVVGGYQADLEAGETYTGILYEEKMSRGIMAGRGEKVLWNKDCKKEVTGSLGKSEEIQAAIKKGDWNDYRVIAQGNHLQHFVNGRQTVDIIDECDSKQAMKGVLALQLHAGPPMTVSFRNLELTTLAADSASAGDDMQKLQGTWQITSVEANGDAVPAEDVTNIVVTIKGSAYTAELPDRTDRGTLKLDSSKQPRHMDIIPGASDSDRVLPGIYEVQDNVLKVCYATQGGKRPTAFSSSGEYGLLLVTYRRKND